jgi:hypothetical protein
MNQTWECGGVNVEVTNGGAVIIKRAKKHIKQPPKLNKNCNLVKCIFVVPL